MNVFEAATSLTFTTDFHRRPVDEKIIGLILHIGTHAPTAGNLQEWAFVVVEDDERKLELSHAAMDLRHVKTAPSVIVICADVRKAALKYGKRGEILYAAEDIGGCVSYMALAAHALDIGFDIIKGFDEEEVKNALNLPENIRPLVLMPVGHPKGRKEERKINPFENVTHVNRWNQKIDIEFEPVFRALKESKSK
jgi:nitroreductase